PHVTGGLGRDGQPVRHAEGRKMTVRRPRRPDNRITRLVLAGLICADRRSRRLEGAAATILGMPTWIAGRYRPGDQPAGGLGPEPRSTVVTDIPGSGRWSNRAHLRGRAALTAMVRAAFRAAGIAWWKLAVEDRGDGMIVLVPAAVSKVDLLDPMIPCLAA